MRCSIKKIICLGVLIFSAKLAFGMDDLADFPSYSSFYFGGPADVIFGLIVDELPSEGIKAPGLEGLFPDIDFPDVEAADDEAVADISSSISSLEDSFSGLTSPFSDDCNRTWHGLLNNWCTEFQCSEEI